MTVAQSAALILAVATARKVRVGRQITPALYTATVVYLTAHRLLRTKTS